MIRNHIVELGLNNGNNSLPKTKILAVDAVADNLALFVGPMICTEKKVAKLGKVVTVDVCRCYRSWSKAGDTRLLATVTVVVVVFVGVDVGRTISQRRRISFAFDITKYEIFFDNSKFSTLEAERE